MNSIDTDDLDAFLIEAELISQKVKALAQNRMTPEQFDQISEQRTEDKRRREEAKIRKQQQAYEKVYRGRDGKGITKDFKNFCRFCHKEYQMETIKCLKCDRPTMTLQQRQKQLEVMVDEYKFSKKQRAQKRQKWEMFQKTQAAMWKKSSINYNKKWQFFIQQSEQQQEKEPILPKNDPNFRALELDMEQRKQRRAKDNQNAKNLKEKGNECMRKADYQKAMQYYTLALEHIKDIKSIYTNRALAFIKLRRYKKAIQDCSKVIEYMQVFEKIGQNQDLTFKAFSRRALARKEIKQYKDALEDITEALRLFPNDKNALLTKTQIQGFIKHTETVQKLIKQSRQQQKVHEQKVQKAEQMIQAEEQDQLTQQNSKSLQKQIIRQLAQTQLKEQIKEQPKNNPETAKIEKQVIKQENPVKEIPQRLSKLNEENIQYLLNLLIKNKDLKSIFISAKGIQKVLDYLFQSQSTKNQALLIIFCIDKDGVAEKRINDWGIFKFYQKIQSKFVDETKLNHSVYAFIDNLFEILVPMTLYEPCRLQLSSSEATFTFITQLFPVLISKYKKQPNLVDNFFIFMSNLCSGESQLKNKYLKKQSFLTIVKTLFVMILEENKSKNRKILDVKQSIYSLIANIITSVQHRKAFVDYSIREEKMVFLKSQLESYPRYAHNFDPFIENMLSLLVNASLQTSIDHIELADSIFDRFVLNWQNYNETIVYRSLLILSRLKYSANKNLSKWMKMFNLISQQSKPLVNIQQKNMGQIIKILNVLFALDKPQAVLHIPDHLFSSLVSFVKQNLVNENLFCNTCNLFGVLLQKKNDLSNRIYEVLRETIEQLVQIAKQKTGNWRKSAAILIAKASGDVKCREEITRTHGMEVLKSIAPFVTNPK